MKVTCELFDYLIKDEAYQRPRVVIKDSNDHDMVEICIESNFGVHTVKVLGKELISATERCMNTRAPFL